MYDTFRRRTTAIRRHSMAPALALLFFVAPSAAGQDSTRALSPDSLSERLRRAEEAITLLRAQMATESESKVQSGARVQVDLFGRVLMNALINSARVNNVDVPQFAVAGVGEGATATIRQTSFGVGVHVPHVLGGALEGEMLTDFFGGQQSSVGGRHFPLLRLRLAKGELRWDRAELLFGQDVPLVAGLNPQSVASFGTPEFATAGNLWLWIPQLRGTWVLSPKGGVAVQGALLAPGTGDAVGGFDTGFDEAERSRRPYVQGRVRVRVGSGERQGEIGAGVHRGWLRRASGALVVSRAVALDAKIPLGPYVEMRGEYYSGQALRGLGGGGIGQNLTTDSVAVRDRGGWWQAILRPNALWSVAAGCGVSDPRDTPPLPAQRLRNRACSSEFTVRPGGPLLFSLGWRSHATRYPSGTVHNTHLNLAAGFEF